MALQSPWMRLGQDQTQTAAPPSLSGGELAQAPQQAADPGIINGGVLGTDVIDRTNLAPGNRGSGQPTASPTGSLNFQPSLSGGTLQPGATPVASPGPGLASPFMPAAQPTTAGIPVSQIGPQGAILGAGQNPFQAPGSPQQASNQAIWDQSGHDPLAFIKAFAQKYNITPQQIPGITGPIAQALKSVGLNVEFDQPDEYGRSAGVMFNGQHYKIIDGSGNWMWDSFDNAEGPAGGQGGQGGGGSNIANQFGDVLNKGGLLTPFTDQFHAPTAEDVQNTPGFQFQLAQGNKALQNSAASRGTLLTGGTLKAIDQFGQGLASTYYSNAYDRAMQEYLNKYNIFTGNQNNIYNKLFGVTSLGANTALGLGTLGQNASGNISNFLTQQGNAGAAGTVGGANAINAGVGTAGNSALAALLLNQNRSSIQNQGSSV